MYILILDFLLCSCRIETLVLKLKDSEVTDYAALSNVLLSSDKEPEVLKSHVLLYIYRFAFHGYFSCLLKKQ